jgi:integrase
MPFRRATDKHLPACVHYKHGAYWYVKRTPGHANPKWTKLGSELAESLVAFAAMHEIANGSSSAGMAALIDKVLAHVAPRLRQSTVHQYRICATQLKKMLAEFSPEQVQPKHIAAIKVALAKTPNFANRCLSVLRVVFAHAVEWQLIDRNPAIGIMRHSERKRTRYLTDDELAAIRAVSGPRLQVIIDLLYCTAQRVSDVLAIRRLNADLAGPGVSFIQGKTGTKLTVEWSPRLRAAVEAAKKLHGNIRALTPLHNRRGKTPDYRTVKLQWDTACKLAGVTDAHMHDVRAKALTDAKRQGHDATALAGHSSAKMTDRYIRLRESPIVKGPTTAR